MTNCDQRHLTCEKRLQYFRRLWRSCQRIYEIFLVVLQVNNRVQQILSCKAAELGSSNVIRVGLKWWKGSSYKPTETSSGWQGVALVFTATAAVMVMVTVGYVGYLSYRKVPHIDDRVVSHIDAGSAGLTYETAANESRTETLQDGTGMTLGAHSKVQENFTAKSRGVQHLGGEAKFDVAPDAAMRPFVVSTFLVDVIAGAGAKFGVVVDTTVTVTAHEGTVRILGRGANPSSPGLTLQPGESRRIPVDGLATVVVGDGVNVARVHPSSS